MKQLLLVGRMLWRDLRSGSLTVMALAQLFAVAALSGVSFLADRVERAVEMQVHQMMGGDLLLTADHVWHEDFREAARTHGLRIAESATFPSMVSGAKGVQLAEIKAVSSTYPLRGKLRIAAGVNQPDTEADAIPARGTVWPDARLASALTLGVGDTLELGVGKARIAAWVTLEPDRGINPFAIAPRLIMPLDDLAATQLIQPASRVTWRLHLAGESEAVAAYRQWAETRLGRGERIESAADARPEIRNIIERVDVFLRLAALLTTVLAAVAVGLAAQRYMALHLDACAVMRCVGASERQILLLHGGEFVMLGVLTTLGGGALGYGLHALMLSLLDGLVGGDLPAAGWLPWVHGAAVGIVLIVGFVLPPLLRLKAVPTLRVLRREWGATTPLTAFSYLAGFVCLVALMLWMAGNVRLGGVVLGGFTASLGFFALGAWLLFAVLARWISPRLRGGWRMGLANLRRRQTSAILQTSALAVGLTTLLVLTLARDDLLNAWRARLPPDAPNRFVINIQPEQRTVSVDFFAAHDLPLPEFAPMIRGRLMRLNGRGVSPHDFVEERARRLVEREFNLSTRADPPPGNEIIAGQWFGAAAPLQFSVEKGLAETLNLHVGDELQFDIAGHAVVGRITSLRKLAWDSMRVNFFVLAPAGTLDEQPASYITSFYLPPGRNAFIDELVRQFPNFTVIDVAALLAQMQGVVDQVSHAVAAVFGFALLAGLATLYAALQMNAAEREREIAVMRALGARRRQIRQIYLGELLMTGGVAGLLAGMVASSLAWGLARWVFSLPFVPALQTLFTGIGLGLFFVVGVGMLAIRRNVSGSVVDRLRSA